MTKARFIISGALHGVTEEAKEVLDTLKKYHVQVYHVDGRKLTLLQFDGILDKIEEDKVISIIKQAGEHCVAHGVVCHGTAECEPIHTIVGKSPK